MATKLSNHEPSPGTMSLINTFVETKMESFSKTNSCERKYKSYFLAYREKPRFISEWPLVNT